MAFLQSINNSASGLTAQRLRMDIISDNLANVNTTRTAEGIPYQRKMAIFAARESQFSSFFEQALGKSSGTGHGVRVVGITKDPTPFKLVYDPQHPDAIKNGDPEALANPSMVGYVRLPNVDIVKEMVDMISATRTYEANVTAINSAKTMALKALEIGRG